MAIKTSAGQHFFPREVHLERLSLGTCVETASLVYVQSNVMATNLNAARQSLKIGTTGCCVCFTASTGMWKQLCMGFALENKY